MNIKRFNEGGGFATIYDILQNPLVPWLGVEKLQIILRALSDTDNGFVSVLGQKIVTQIMKQLTDLSEDLLKKESTDSLVAMVKAMLPRRDGTLYSTYQTFLLDFTFKMMNSGSIVLKLCAWEQINEIIREAYATRPPPANYLVRNAGTAEVNGTYKGVFKEGEIPKYVKYPSTPDGHIFTLFRCTMRSKHKWWFISIADIEKPGTDKDIDYYQHKSNIEQESEPPTFGWLCMPGNAARGLEPPPVLIRLDPMVPKNGDDTKLSLMTSLCNWVDNHKVIEHVFSASTHREIISRSKSLLIMLTEEDKLSNEMLQTIWKVAITSHNEEIYEEIFILLASICQYLSDVMFDGLMDVINSVVESVTSSATPEFEQLIKVTEFIDKLHTEGGLRFFRAVSDHVKIRIVNLVWTLYNHPLVNSESCKNYGNIEFYLSLCLNNIGDKNIVLTFIRESAALLASFKEQQQPHSSTDEKKVSRIIQTLQFLLSNHSSSGYDEILYAENFYDTLLDELNRFVTHQNKLDSAVVAHTNNSTANNRSPGKENVYHEWYIQQIAKRLNLIRVAYGMSNRVNMSRESLNHMSQLLSHSASDREQFFVFLKQGGLKQQPLESAFDINECMHVFTTMVCSPEVDWSACGEDSFQCFQTYFNGLVSKRGDLSAVDRNNAYNTLWLIVFNIKSEMTAKNAIGLLLKAYDDLTSADTSAHLQLLTRIFDQLNAGKIKLESALDVAEAEASNNSSTEVELMRCVELLYEAIAKSKVIANHISNYPHVTRGSTSRIKLCVKYREVSYVTQYPINQYNRSMYDKSVEKTSVIDINSMHSLFTLKSKISQNSKFGNPRKITIDFAGMTLNGDTSSLNSFGIVDGSTINASLLHTTVSTTFDDDEFNELYYNHNNGNSSTTTPNYSLNNSFNNANTVGNNDGGDSDTELIINSYNSMNIPSQGQPASAASGPEADAGEVEITSFVASNYNFNCLISLLNILSKLPRPPSELMRSLWSLLMSIPTQPELLESIKSLVDTDDTTAWNNIFDESCTVYKSTYILQIIDSILQPAPEIIEQQFPIQVNSNQIDGGDDEEDYHEHLVKSYLGELKRKFTVNGGFLRILRYFASSTTSKNEDRVTKLSLSIALHILHYCLFDRESGTSTPNPSLIHIVQQSSDTVLEKLLIVAHNAAAESDESSVVQDALATISCLIQTPVIALQLINNPQSKSFLKAVLRSESKVVRDMASRFAVQVGKTQFVVIEWLLDDISTMAHTEKNSYDIFKSCAELVSHMKWTISEDDDEASKRYNSTVRSIANMLSSKLMSFSPDVGTSTSVTSNNVDSENLYQQTSADIYNKSSILLGCLQLLDCIIGINCVAVQETELGKALVEKFIFDFLFAKPSKGKDKKPICNTSQTRHAAFSVLASFLKHSTLESPSNTMFDCFSNVVKQLDAMSIQISSQIKYQFGLQVAHDLKRPNIDFAGLKNQGCTCYLNSLLQQLFMCDSFRKAVMLTPLKAQHRTYGWHIEDADFVEKDILVEWVDGSWKHAKVEGFNPRTGYHHLRYQEENVLVCYNLHAGRFHKETGRIKVIDSTVDVASIQMTEREEQATLVLEQLQRTFCFMEKSNKRFFDPRPFIESCKTLNLNFNIYHQNDACEFADQLFDRLETVMKGKFTHKDMWKNDMTKNVFGGKMLYQKIPKECGAYEQEKSACGHWKSTRSENFLKVELIIRGKETIEESFDALTEGELMDGDNKIMCEECNMKKDTVRRTCFGKLPNLLMLHLKRFDLDFNTFETVKLNNKLIFPRRLNMCKYTKEGIEMEEKLGAVLPTANDNDEADEENGDDNESARFPPLIRHSSKESHADQPNANVTTTDSTNTLDRTDYDYELQGVLVHAGAAQGGHYYSYIRDGKSGDNWYRFDDDDVSLFNPDNIPAQCYGGTYTTSIQGAQNSIEEDRTANALMLFYRKVKPIENVEDDSISSTDVELSIYDSNELNGYEAFDREVEVSNLKHIMLSYLLDSDLHHFVKNFLSICSELDSAIATNDLIAEHTKVIHEAVDFSFKFLLDIVLHCRERASSSAWVTTIKKLFANNIAYPVRFLNGLINVGSQEHAWLREFLFVCYDSLSRGTFTQIVYCAVSSIMNSSTESHISKLREHTRESLMSFLRDVSLPETFRSQVTVVLLLRMLLDMLVDVPSHVRNSDEFFILLRELASIPSIAQYMIDDEVIARIAYFIAPDRAPDPIKEIYLSRTSVSKLMPGDCNILGGIVFEVISTLLGVPPLPKWHLFTDDSNVELTPAVITALTTMFFESSHNEGMDSRDIYNYMDKIHKNDDVSTPKVTNVQVRSILDKYETTTDGRLSLAGFLDYYAETAKTYPRSVWKDLKAFNFQSNLVRTTPNEMALHDHDGNVISPLPAMPTFSVQSLINMALFEAGYSTSESTAITILQRLCYGNVHISLALIKQVRLKFYNIII